MGLVNRPPSCWERCWAFWPAVCGITVCICLIPGTRLAAIVWRRHASPAAHGKAPRMANGLSRLWARVTGLTGWNQEVESLHNIVGDETPPPGATSLAEPPGNAQDPPPLTTKESKQRYGHWEGEDPGH